MGESKFLSLVPGADEAPAAAGLAIHRSIVGDPAWYDVQSACQFHLLTTLGLREYHSLLDIGCGSLRGGRLFIGYLLPECYCGLELQPWLVQEGIEKELGRSVVELKRPSFSHDPEFTLSTFGRQFDFLLAHSIFSHTPEHEIRRCMAEAAKVMKPTSIFAATYWAGTSNSRGHSWMIRAEYTPEHMCELVEEAGLEFRPIEWAQHDLQCWFLALPRGSTFEFPSAADGRVQRLEQQLELTTRQLTTIRAHPWVRLGHKLRYALVWVRLLRQLGRFRNESVARYLSMRLALTRASIARWLARRSDDSQG